MQLNDFNSMLHVLKLFEDLKNMSDLEIIQICTTYMLTTYLQPSLLNFEGA